MVDAALGRDLRRNAFAATRAAAAGRGEIDDASWRYIPRLTIALALILAGAALVAPDHGSDDPRARPSARAATSFPDPAAEIMTSAGTGSSGAEPAPAWVRIERPLVSFRLVSPDLDRLARAYEAARHATGGGRDDVLRFGDFATPALHLHLSAYRPGREAAPPSTFFVDLVRRAGEAGLAVARSEVAAPLATKFGPVETADARLANHAGDRLCLAFRMIAPDTGLRLSGWACGTPAKPLDRPRLACLIERFDLLAGAGDKALAAAFARAEQRRSETCTGPHLVATDRKSTWLDAGAALPPLKSGLKGR